MTAAAQLARQLATAQRSVQAALGAVEDIRARIAALQAERAAVEAAPAAQEEAAETLSRMLSSWRAAYQGQLGVVMAHLAAGKERTLLPDITAVDGRELSQLLAGLLAPIIENSLTQALDQYYAGISPGPPRQERARRIAELDAQIRQLEADEEAMVELAEAAGIAITRRPDADPAIVLGVE